MPHLVHPDFEIGDILFKIDSRRRNIESLIVYATSHVVKPRADIDGQVTELRLKLQGVCVFVASFNRQLQSL